MSGQPKYPTTQEKDSFSRKPVRRVGVYNSSRLARYKEDRRGNGKTTSRPSRLPLPDAIRRLLSSCFDIGDWCFWQVVGGGGLGGGGDLPYVPLDAVSVHGGMAILSLRIGAGKTCPVLPAPPSNDFCLTL